MKAIKYLILTILTLSASEAYAQGSFVLWGCNDKVKGWETFTFVVNQPGVISGIIVEKNLNFEAYIQDSEKMLWFNNSDMKGKSLEISANLNSAVLWLPDGSCVQYKLVLPPVSAMQNYPIINNGYSTNGGSCVGTKTCSLCNGKGWIAGCSTTTYVNTGSYYCPDCGRSVPQSHSHDICPSCGGKGTTPTIR